MSAYRGGGAGRVDVVTLATPRWAYLVSAAALGFVLFVLAAVSPSERLTCEPGGACRLDTWHLVHVWPDVEVFPAAELERAEIETVKDDEDSDLSGVVLVVAGRRVELNGHSNIDDDVKGQWVAAVRAWIDAGRSTPLELLHERSWIVLFAFPWLLGASAFHAGYGLRATVDRRAGVLTTSRFRWGVAAHRFDLARVRGARVVEEDGSEGGTVAAIEIVLDDAEPVRVTLMSETQRAAKRRFVERLEAVLRGDEPVDS